MASITIRNLDERLKDRLRICAATNGRSMEEEVREILRIILTQETQPSSDLATAIHSRFKKIGADIPLPPRDEIREPPQFGLKEGENICDFEDDR